MSKGAPQGNEFWKLRSKHGREMIFETGDNIKTAADEFLLHIVANPLRGEAFVGKDGKREITYHYRVPTWNRFALFCDVNTGYFRDLRASIKEKNDEKSKDFSSALAYVEDLFFSEKFEAACAGLANPGLIGKHLGIVEVQKVESTNTNVNLNSNPLSRDEIRDISKQLEDEF